MREIALDKKAYTISLVGLTLLVSLCWSEYVSSDTEHRRFNLILHDGLVATDVAHLSTALENNYHRITSELQLTTLPSITVQIWRDETAYQDAMQITLGSRAPGSRGYITGDNELRLLYHQRLSAQKEAVHEFVHVASLHVNPEFGNNPRWLWEAVAIFLASERVDPKTSTHFKNSTCPSLDTLNSPFDQGGTIYDAGYLLIDFIQMRWGFDSVVELIRNNGNIELALGQTAEIFEGEWCAYVGGKN